LNRLLSATDALGNVSRTDYDARSNVIRQIDQEGHVTSATYDALDRLTTVSYPADGTYPSGRVVTYGYDRVGNRVQELERAGTGETLADKQGIFDSTNRLQTLTDASKAPEDPEHLVSFGWDANGNQVSKTTGTGAAAVTTTYAYDARDKLVEVQQGASVLGRFQYDFEGRRTKKIGEEGLRQYVYDDTSLLVEYDASGVAKAKYDYGSDRLLALTRADEGRRYFSLDGLRSVAADGGVAADTVEELAALADAYLAGGGKLRGLAARRRA